jgi:hypothetical protein
MATSFRARGPIFHQMSHPPDIRAKVRPSTANRVALSDF